MTIRLAPCLAFVALSACGQPARSPTAPAAAEQTAAQLPTKQTITYRCGNGRTLEAAYAGDKAIIEWGDKRRELKITRSASGARYVGDGLQWWTKGMREGTLSELKLGELVASDVGITCTTDEVLPPATPPPPTKPAS